MFYRNHSRVTVNTGPIVMTQQHHKDACDINNILKQYQRTGIISHVQAARPTYEDLPSDLDFQSALSLVSEASEAFDALPSKVRHHFNNDPSLFLAAFQDPRQADQLREFGLLNPLPSPSPSSQPSEAS